MKLSKHEKKIVDAIIQGDVYDIPSYLRKFGKCQNRKYDIYALEERFKATDGAKQYKVVIDEDKFYTIVPSCAKLPFGGSFSTELKLPRKPEDVPDDSWEFRNAELINDLKPIEITYLEHTFSLDFTNNGEYVADHFEDIVEFMTLWAYLRQESLIVEVPREVKAEDLSILFELVPKQQQDKATYTVLGDKKPDSSLRPVINTIDVGDYWPTTPHFLISKYNDMVWKVNEEHLKNCEEYIGRKILPTGRLKVFAKQGYTTAEVWQYRIPLIISLVALIAPTLFSGFTKGETDYLSEISQQLVIIEEKTDANSVHQDILSKIIEIKDELSDISEQLASDDSVEVIANLASQIEELNRLLSEPESPETPTE